jgi:hypothetical protein
MSLLRFVGRHQGATAWLFGKGPTFDNYLASANHVTESHEPDTVKMAVNETVLVVNDPDYFFAHDVLGIDRSMDPWNHGFAKGKADTDPRVRPAYPRDCTAILRKEQITAALKHAIDPGRVYGYRKAQQEKKLLGLSALDLAKSGALYAESATIQSACHFAKLTGCARVVLVGVDGGHGTASVFKNMGCAKGPWYTKNRGDTHRILEAMGMPFTVWGE